MLFKSGDFTFKLRVNVGVAKKQKTCLAFSPNTLAKFSTICFSRGTILERQSNRIGHAEPGSVALPGIMRAGGPGATQFDVGQMQAAQYSTVSGHAKSGHQAPMVITHREHFLLYLDCYAKL